jgi:hypothetical protein
MPRRPRLRHLVALASCGAVASALALPVAPASAITLPPSQLSLQGSVNFSTSGPTCSAVGTEPNQTTAFTHGRASDTLSMDVTVTNTDATTPDPADHTRVLGTLTAKGTRTLKHGSLSSYRTTGTGKVTVTRAEGAASQCGVTADVVASSMVFFNEAKAGWLYVTRSQAKHLLVEMALQSETGDSPYIQIFGGPKSTSTERVFLKPGAYAALSAFIVSSSNSGIFLKAPAPSATLSGAFHVAGSALGAAKGSAALAFPAAVSCQHHTATLRWKSVAGVMGAAFYVNGAKKAADGNPVAGHSVTLRHLSRTADLHVTAKLSLRGGRHATATRTYVACKG